MFCLQHPDVLEMLFLNYQEYIFNLQTMQNHMHLTHILFRASSLALPFKFHPMVSHLFLSLSLLSHISYQILLHRIYCDKMT